MSGFATAGLKLLTPSGPPTLASQSAGITSVSPCAQPPCFLIFHKGLKFHGLTTVPLIWKAVVNSEYLRTHDSAMDTVAFQVTDPTECADQGVPS